MFLKFRSTRSLCHELTTRRWCKEFVTFTRRILELSKSTIPIQDRLTPEELVRYNIGEQYELQMQLEQVPRIESFQFSQPRLSPEEAATLRKEWKGSTGTVSQFDFEEVKLVPGIRKSKTQQRLEAFDNQMPFLFAGCRVRCISVPTDTVESLKLGLPYVVGTVHPKHVELLGIDDVLFPKECFEIEETDS